MFYCEKQSPHPPQTHSSQPQRVRAWTTQHPPTAQNRPRDSLETPKHLHDASSLPALPVSVPWRSHSAASLVITAHARTRACCRFSAALPLEEPRGGVFAMPSALGFLCHVSVCVLLVSGDCHPSTHHLARACCLPACYPQLCLLVPVQVLAFLRSGACFTSCRLPVHSLVAPLLPALVVSSWLPAGCQYSLRLFLMAPCLRPTAHR